MRASLLEIPLSPLFVVVEYGAWISGVVVSVPLSLSRPQFIGVLVVVASPAFPSTVAVAFVPGVITSANARSEPRIACVSLAFRREDRLAVGRVPLAI